MKKYDLMFSHLGNGTTVANRAVEVRGDYKTIAHISQDGQTIKFYEKQTPSDVRQQIRTQANIEAARYIAQTGYSFALILTAVGNVDFNQDPYSDYAEPLVITVRDLAEAQWKVRHYISQYNLGGGNFTGGQVYHPSLDLFARISYNGRVWTVEGSAPEYLGKEITDPALLKQPYYYFVEPQKTFRHEDHSGRMLQEELSEKFIRNHWFTDQATDTEGRTLADYLDKCEMGEEFTSEEALITLTRIN